MTEEMSEKQKAISVLEKKIKSKERRRRARWLIAHVLCVILVAISVVGLLDFLQGLGLIFLILLFCVILEIRDEREIEEQRLVLASLIEAEEKK